jgi:carbamoyl-phosphate synthase large subunit
MESMAEEEAHFPILIEQFLKNAIEVEVDGVSDGETVFIPGVMEQVEPLGVHSGDSICCFPAYSLSPMIQEKIIDQAKQLALACHIIGAFNIQFAVKNESIFIIEMNPRSSRTVPFLSKAIGVSLPQLATSCILGQKLTEQKKINMPQASYFAIKIPTFPFARLGACELGPNMRSTGEKMFFTHENPAAHAGFIAAVTSLVQPLQELTA